MNANIPSVSVVIPAWNQARYLTDSVQSVLRQTYTDYEIIVVDDGSTDNTPEVVKKFCGQVRYIRQENRGLAGARNTGIRQALAPYVAFLDSDDAWLPSFLASMMSLTRMRSEAAVFYCGVVYMDKNGTQLPQSGRVRILPPHKLYDTLLQYNFLIPSAIVINRAAVIRAGLFDASLRRVEDWELWIRLLRRGEVFAGLDKCLVRYRIHEGTLSTDVAPGQQAAKAIFEKHFGHDDGQPECWDAEKRRAYGGFYRYCALTTSLMQKGDWGECARFLRKAFQADESLVVDLDLFYELALGVEERGYRNTSQNTDLASNSARMMNLLKIVFERSNSALAALRRPAYGTAYYALGSVAYSSQAPPSRCRHFLRKAFAFRPDLLADGRALGLLARSVPGRSRINRVRGIIRRPSPTS